MKLPDLIKFEHEVQRGCDILSRKGMRLDVPYTAALQSRQAQEIVQHKLKAKALGCANVSAPAQVGDALVALGAELTERTAGGQLKVDDKTLAEFEKRDDELGELVRAIYGAKRAAKRKASYVDAMLRLRDSQDRVHASIRSLAARTARMSVSDPPFQQLPSGEHEIRSCLIADEGHVIITADYDQVEMRVAAALAHEPTMIQAAQEGRSIHKVVATQVFGPDYTDAEYKKAKGLGFGFLFGGGANHLSKQAGIPLKDAQELGAMFKDSFPPLNQWKEDLTNRVLDQALTTSERREFVSLRTKMYRAKEAGEREAARKRMKAITWGKYGTITTPIGRILPVDADRAYAGVNYVIQSTARDVMAMGMLRVQRAMPNTTLMVVHDELVGQAPEDRAEEFAAVYAAIMNYEFRDVPLTAEGEVAGRSWGDKYRKKEEQ